MPDDDGERPGHLSLDPNLRIIFCVTLMAVLGVASVTPAFPMIAEELGMSAWDIGLLITVFTLPGMLLTPVLGVLFSLIAYKTVLLGSASERGAGCLGSLGVILGIIAPGCAACGIGLASARARRGSPSCPSGDWSFPFSRS